MKAKLTPWFSAKTPPVRVGWYDAQYCFGSTIPVERLWFDGKMWLFKKNGEQTDFGRHFLLEDKWRGLAEKP